MFCPHCGVKRLDMVGSCQGCGQQGFDLLGGVLDLPDEITQEGSCPNCGSSLLGDEMFCGECGVLVAELPRLAVTPSRTPLLLGFLCFTASLLSGATALWLATSR